MKVYFTHSSVSFFGGGWTEVDANDMRYAVSVYRLEKGD